MQIGVCDNLFEEVLNVAVLNEIKKAAELVERKYGVWDYDIKEKRRIEGFLLRKGYSYDIIKETFDLLENI